MFLEKTNDSSLDAYKLGYQNSLSDVFEFLDDYSDSNQLLIDLAQYIKEHETDVQSLTGKNSL